MPFSRPTPTPTTFPPIHTIQNNRPGMNQTWPCALITMLAFVCAGLTTHDTAALAARHDTNEQVSAANSAPAVGHETTGVVANNEPLPRRHRFIYNNLVAARGAPLGLVERMEIGYRRQLIRRHGALFADSQTSAKLRVGLTPASIGAGPRIEIQPLTVIRFAASYQYVQYFNTFGSLQSFPNAQVDHSTQTQKQRAAAGQDYAARGHQVDLELLAQLKFGPVVVRNDSSFRYVNFDLEVGDTVFYDKFVDTLLPNAAFTFVNFLDLLVELSPGMYVGARWDVVAPLYAAEHGAGASREDSSNGPIHRLGPSVIWEFYDRPGSRFNKPSVFLLAQWHLTHRYRTGQEFDRGVPMISAGMFFSGDLWSRP